LTAAPHGCRTEARKLTVIVEEWKSARTLQPHHRAQLGVYFLLVEEQVAVRPAYGVIVGGDGAQLLCVLDSVPRAWVLELAGCIRAARAEVRRPIPVHPLPQQCRRCGMRDRCARRRL
jgi:hypothetical protein